MSADYCRLARWRTSDPKQRDKAANPKVKPTPQQEIARLKERLKKESR